MPTKRKAYDANDGPPTEARRVIRMPIVARAPSRQARQGHTGRGGRGGQWTLAEELTRTSLEQCIRKRKRPLDTNSEALHSNDLCVTVSLEPYKDLSLAQAEAVKSQLDRVLDGEIFTPDESNAFVIPPQFRGKAFVTEGVLKFYCNDRLTAC